MSCSPDVLVIGATGYIGSRLCALLEADGTAFQVLPSELRLGTDDAAIAEALAAFRDAGGTRVLCAAAVTGVPNVDACEEPAAREETFRVNCLATAELVRACVALGLHCTLYSSGCVFEYDAAHLNNDSSVLDGFDELSWPNFYGSVYSASKAELERRLRTDPTTRPAPADDALPTTPPPPPTGAALNNDHRCLIDDCLLLRIRMPISDDGDPKCLLTKLRGHAFVVDDAWNSVTRLATALPASLRLSEARVRGIVNLVDPEPVVPWRLLCDADTEEVVRARGQNPISFRALQARGLVVAPRSNCVLRATDLDARIAAALEA